MASANGQVATGKPRGKPFGSPDGPDPSENGANGARERERRRLDRIGETRERLELHADKAADTLVELLDAEDPRLRLRAATAVLERVLGPVAKENPPAQANAASAEWNERVEAAVDEWIQGVQQEQAEAKEVLARAERLTRLEERLGPGQVEELLRDG